MCRFLLLAAISLLAAAPARAHVPGSRPGYIPEFPLDQLPDLHDGTLADWERLKFAPAFTEADFRSLNVGDGAPIGPPDLAVKVFLGWSSATNRLYAAVERLDDAYVNAYEGGDLINLWRHDSIEFMVDGDHTGGPYNGFVDDCYYKPVASKAVVAGVSKLAMPLDLSPSYWDDCVELDNRQAQQYVAIAAAPDGRQLAAQKQRANDWLTVPPYGDVGGFLEEGEPHRSVIELMVTPYDDLLSSGPESSTETRLAPGRIIGLQLSLPDFDEGPGKYHSFHTLEGQANTWRLAENFVDCLLLPWDPELARAMFDPEAVNVTDFRVQDENNDGLLDAGETGRLEYIPPLNRRPPAGGLSARLRCLDPYLRLLRDEGFTTDTFPFEPLTFTWPVEAPGRTQVALSLELEQRSGTTTWPLWVTAQSPRLPAPSVVVMDAPPEGRGNGDGVVQPGETVSLSLALGTGDLKVVEGTTGEFAVIDARLSLLEQTPLRFGLATGGQVRSASTIRYLVSSRAAAGDSLRFALSTRRPYAAWAETLALRVGEGGDQVPPAFTGQAQVWWGEEGFTVLYGRDDFVEGGQIEQVEARLSLATGGPAISLPLETNRGYWRGLLRGVPVGDYTYLLTAVDQAGNAGRTAPVPLRLEEPRPFGQTRALLGGGTRTGPAIGTYRQVLGPIGLTVDHQGRLWVADSGLHQVIRWDRTGVTEVMAGAVPPRAGLAGDGGQAIEALLNQPAGLAVDARGRVYVADSRNHRVRRLDPDGTITTVAGTDSGFAGDGGLASAARLSSPQGLALDRAGNLYLADTGNRRVRRVDTRGIITTVAGSGAAASGGDGGPAIAAGLLEPLAVAVDTSGTLYVADAEGHRVRRISVDGTITTAAGTGSQRSPAGDGAPAATVQLRQPSGLLLDGAGALYIADRYRVSRVDPRGIFTTVMNTADDQIYLPAGLAANERGDLYVSDPGVQRVMVKTGAVTPVPLLPTVASAAALPPAFALWPNYPNPFNPTTQIRFSLAGEGATELAVYDLLGQQVRLLLSGPFEAGTHQTRWDSQDQQGRPVASGIYLLDLQAGGQRQVRKMLLLR